MDTKANLNNRKKINDLAIQHNKLTTLVACLLNEVIGLKKELQSVRGGGNSDTNNMSSQSSQSSQSSNQQNSVRNNSSHQSNPNKFPNFNDLRAEDILKQLSINTSAN